MTGGSGDFYTPAEAGALLGVSARRVRQMLDDGQLVRAARGLVDATSVDQHRARTADQHRTRVWSEHTAWAAIAMLSEVLPDWVGAPQASRLRTALREVNAADLVARTRGRAVARTFRGHPAAIRRLAQDLVVTDSAVLGLVAAAEGGPAGSAAGAAPDRIRGYYPGAQLDSAVKFFGLVEDAAGNVVVRATGFDIAIVCELAEARVPVLTALDAATSLDPRERGLGMGAVQAALDRYRQ